MELNNDIVLSTDKLHASRALHWWLMMLCILALLAAVLRMFGISLTTFTKTAQANAQSSAGDSSSGATQLDMSIPLVCLINSKSGGGLGSRVMALLGSLQGPLHVYALSKDGISDAIRTLLWHRGKGYLPRLVCAGGDGTVTAVVRVLLERNLATVAVAVMPLGTGNDCARSLHSSLPVLTQQCMLKWLRNAQTARVVQRDVFDLYFDTHPGGSIVCVRDKTETQLSETVVRGTSLMYMSIGLDSRCVYTVELNRQRNRLLNQLTYFLAGAINTFACRPAMSHNIASLELDGMPIDVRQLPHALQSMICLLIPSYAGGTNVWQFASTLAAAVYTRLAMAAAVPSSALHDDGPGEGAAAGDGRLRAGWPSSGIGKEPWSKQATDDGCFEVIGVRSLFHLGAAIGLKTGLAGGIWRLGQPRSIAVRFSVPSGASSSASIHTPPLGPLPPPAASLAIPEGQAQLRNTKFSPTGAAAALKRVVGSTAKKLRLRSRRKLKSITLAPPELEEDDECAGSDEATDHYAEEAAPECNIASPPRHQHARGYALAPNGEIVTPLGTHHGRGASGFPIVPAVATPPPAVEHSELAEPVTVMQGGRFAETEPIFLQVDGEGYKVYALRQVTLNFRARATLVNFAT